MTRLLTIFLFFLFQLGCPQEVHSFDVFDTLVGRLHKESRTIFDQMEIKSGIVGFAQARISAESKSPGTLAVIYDQLAKDFGLTFAKTYELRQLELATELKNVFPIQVNLNKVQDGDILVSDTFYTETELRSILAKIGLAKKVEVFATYNGKLNRSVWPTLLERFKIIAHFGDNPKSDVESPASFGIPGILFKEASYSTHEQQIYQAGEIGLANLSRTLRLLNPYQENSLPYRSWDEQARINIPILVTSSQFLNEFAQKNGKNRLLFSMRGTVHAMRIFQNLFPAYESVYFHTSRLAYLNPSPEYVSYVKGIYNSDAFIVDESGTGKSFTSFFETHLPSLKPIQVAICRIGKQKFGITYNRCTHFERYNYALEGTLAGYDKNGPIRRSPGYDIELVRPAHLCIDQALKLLNQYKFGAFNQVLADRLATAESNFKSVYGDLPEFVREHI